MDLICVSVAAQDDDLFWNDLCRILERHFPLLQIREQSVIANCKAAEMIVTRQADIGHILADNIVVVFRNKPDVPPESYSGIGAIAVVNAGDSELARYVAETGLPAVTCGLSSRDTITLSSIAGDSAVISLQRTVECFNGSFAEPQEIPVSTEESVEGFALLSAAAICILASRPY